MIRESDAINELGKQLREKYSRVPKNENERIMDQVQKLLFQSEKSFAPKKYFLEEAAKVISRLSGFMEVSIGLKDQRDNFFKFVAFVGFRKETEIATSNLRYTYEDMFDSNKYPRMKLSDLTDFYPAEWKPYQIGEEESYARPSKLGEMRSSPDDLIEGDYFDVYIYGPGKKLMGWIELGRTKDGKFPSRETMKWIEFIATIIGRSL